MSGPALRRAAGNALTDAGIIVPPEVLDVLLRYATTGTREEAIEAVRATYPDLPRGFTAKLVDLVVEATTTA